MPSDDQSKNSKRQKKPTNPMTDRLIRGISFSILLIAVIASLFVRSIESSHSVDTSELSRLARSRSNLFFKLVVMQSLSMELLTTDEEKSTLRNSILRELLEIDTDADMRSVEVEVQKRMVLVYIGENISGYDPKGLGSYQSAFEKFYSSSVAGAVSVDLPADDPIFDLPATRLALLSFAKRNDPEGYAKIHSELVDEVASLQVKLGFATMTFLFLMMFGFYVFVRFIVRRPPAYYSKFLETIIPTDRPAFIESAILFLFLIFPLSLLLSRWLPQSVIFEFNFGFTILAFVLSLLYFKSESRPGTTSWLFWIPVMNERPGLNVLVTEETDVSNEKPAVFTDRNRLTIATKPFFSLVLKEVGIGIAAWAMIVPIGVVAMLVSMAVMGGSGTEVRFAHPIVFHLEDHFWLAFVLAVIVVPVIEEVIFRNFVYGFFRFQFSMIFAAVLSGFFFAILHPQGMVAVPYLTVLGAGLAILREHRPNIIAPIVTHMIVNGFALVSMRMLF